MKPCKIFIEFDKRVNEEEYCTQKIEAGIPQGRVLGQFFTCDIQQMQNMAESTEILAISKTI